MEGLQGLLTDVCRDKVLDNGEKLTMIKEWERIVIHRFSGIIMDKQMIEKYNLALEQLENAKRIVGK